MKKEYIRWKTGSWDFIYLELPGYYHRFIPNLMKYIAPLKERQTSEFSSKPVGKGLVLEKRGTDLRNWTPWDQKFQWDQEQKNRNPGVEENA